MLPIIFINLDSDTQRCARMEAGFRRWGLVGQRFEATRWTALTCAQQDKLYSVDLNRRQFYKPLVNGERGCYASHLRAWRWLLDSAYSALVVMEDDVSLEPVFGAVIESIEKLPPDWDMIKLIGRLDRREKVRKSRALLDGICLVDYIRVPSLTAAYVVSRAGAEKLLASRSPFGRPIDVDLRYWWENDLRIRGLVPAAVSLDETSLQSSIGVRGTDRTLARRWRKFRFQVTYTLLNWWHRPHGKVRGQE
jgi:glycosyl transferase family 25